MLNVHSNQPGFDPFDTPDLIIPSDEQTSRALASSDPLACSFVYVPNGFPASSRPIYLVNAGAKITYGADDSAYRTWARFVDRIVASRSSSSSILHSISYDRGAEYLKRSAYSERMITHAPPAKDHLFRRKDGEQGLHFHSLTDAVKLYRELARAHCAPIIISPVLMTGYSFPDDECRLVVFLKSPYPNTNSKLMKVRAMLDKYYIPGKVSQDLQQGAGRGWRSKDDWCEVFIVDIAAMGYCYGGNYRGLVPPEFNIKFWKEAGLPAPLRKKV